MSGATLPGRGTPEVGPASCHLTGTPKKTGGEDRRPSVYASWRPLSCEGATG